MNNDIEAHRERLAAALVEHAQRPEVGAVGARLSPRRHASARRRRARARRRRRAHPHRPAAGRHGYFGWDVVVRPYSAVTGACMMTARALFEELGGFDEEFTVAYGDVDYCMRLADAGFRCLYCRTRRWCITSR